MELNETEEETAIREVNEETNIDISIDNNFRCSIEYQVDNKNIMKEVVYFIGIPKTYDIKPQLEEISDIKWLDYEETLTTITFDNTREVFVKAHQYLIKR